jgi:hypothetical protein
MMGGKHFIFVKVNHICWIVEWLFHDIWPAVVIVIKITR